MVQLVAYMTETRSSASGGWKSRVTVDRYAKFATGQLAVEAARIESGMLESMVNPFGPKGLTMSPV